VGIGQSLASAASPVRVVWADSAVTDLDAIQGYYRDVVGSPHAAANVGRAILAAGDALDVLPLRGQRQADGTYEFPVLAYPQFRLIYRVDEVAGQVGIAHVETTRTVVPRPAARK